MKSIWLDENDPADLRAEFPHIPCDRASAHDGHAWRGSRREFGGAVEVIRTYWCEGIPSAPESPATAPTPPHPHHEAHHTPGDPQQTGGER